MAPAFALTDYHVLRPSHIISHLYFFLRLSQHASYL